MLELKLDDLQDIHSAIINNTELNCPIDLNDLENMVSDYIDKDYLNNEVYFVFPAFMISTIFLCLLSYLYLQVS